MASENIKVIAESSSTRTEWALVQGDTIIGHAYTEGLNPFFQTRREISHIIRLGLPAEFFKRRWSHVYYYGAGCSSPEKNKIVESSLVAQFKTPVSVDSDWWVPLAVCWYMSQDLRAFSAPVPTPASTMVRKLCSVCVLVAISSAMRAVVQPWAAYLWATF